MYKIAVMGAYDSIYGFASLGLDIHPVSDIREGEETLRRLATGEYAVIYITEELAAQHGLPYCSSSTGPSYQVWGMDKIREMFDSSVPEQFRNYNYGGYLW